MKKPKPIPRDHQGLYSTPSFYAGVQTEFQEKIKMEEEEEEEEKQYKNKVVFLRKSKKGDHLFAFDSKEVLEVGGTLIANVAEVQAVLDGKAAWCKLSVLPPQEKGEGRKESGD